jgi:hypothetical protein
MRLYSSATPAALPLLAVLTASFFEQVDWTHFLVALLTFISTAWLQSRGQQVPVSPDLANELVKLLRQITERLPPGPPVSAKPSTPTEGKVPDKAPDAGAGSGRPGGGFSTFGGQ